MILELALGTAFSEHAHSEVDIRHFGRQIACADVILLSKADLSTEVQLSRVEERIQSCNASAPIYRTVMGDIDLKHVIGINAYSGKPFEELLLRLHHGHDHDELGHERHDIKPSYGSVVSIQVDMPVMTPQKAQKLDEWIRSILWEGKLLGWKNETAREDGQTKLEVLRCKGVYCMENGEVFVLQGVRNMYEINPIHVGGDVMGVPEEGKLVFIGKGLGEDAKASLLAVLQ